MKILVAVKKVTTAEDEFEIEDRRIGDSFAGYELNGWDDYAIEEAVQIEESGGDVEVVTVTIGPERTAETIRATEWPAAESPRPLPDVMINRRVPWSREKVLAIERLRTTTAVVIEVLGTSHFS